MGRGAAGKTWPWKYTVSKMFKQMFQQVNTNVVEKIQFFLYEDLEAFVLELAKSEMQT